MTEHAARVFSNSRNGRRGEEAQAGRRMRPRRVGRIDDLGLLARALCTSTVLTAPSSRPQCPSHPILPYLRRVYEDARIWPPHLVYILRPGQGACTNFQTSGLAVCLLMLWITGIPYEDMLVHSRRRPSLHSVDK